MGRRSSPTGSRKMYSGSHTLELYTKNRKKDTHRSLWLLVFKKKELVIPFVPFHLHISHKTLCLTPKFCIPFVFPFSGYYTHPKRNWRQCFSKILWGKQGVLWEMCKWRILENNASKSGERTRDSRFIWRISKDPKPGGWGGGEVTSRNQFSLTTRLGS